MNNQHSNEPTGLNGAHPVRPFGVTVIAIVLVVNAIVGVVRIGFQGATLQSVVERIDYLQLINPAFGFIGLFIAIGLWRLDRWAWVITMLWAGLNMATSLFAYVNGREHFVSMALSVVAVFYLNQRDVQITFLGQSLRPDPIDD